MNTEEKRKKLFRLTTKRQIIFGRVTRMIEMSIGSKKLGLNYLECPSNLSAEQVANKQQIYKADIAQYKESIDVLCVVQLHQQPYLLDFWLSEDRGWQSEWDIPLDVFERAMVTTIEILERYNLHTTNLQSPYDESIQLIQKLLAYRKS